MRIDNFCATELLSDTTTHEYGLDFDIDIAILDRDTGLLDAQGEDQVYRGHRDCHLLHGCHHDSNEQILRIIRRRGER